MLITEPASLRAFCAEHRMWQGIPGIERTKGGRIYACFYSGGVTEQMGNFAALVKSEDGGKTFSEPIAVADMGDKARAYDSALWIDPLGRLWFIWSVMPESRVEFAVCDKPDAEVLAWSPVRLMGHDVMLNKPIVTRGGDWLFPMAVWDPRLVTGSAGGSDGVHETGAHVLRTRDQGMTFEKIGTVIAPDRWFDEHMLLEKQDGTLDMYIRTKYGIGKAVSADGGCTWSEAADSGLGGPNSRFCMRRLRSGRVLLVNHYQFTGRSHLTAMLSDDDGATFPHKLLLDERREVSYPDVCEDDEGGIYIIYDHERGAQYEKDADYSAHEREILMAKITEDDIVSGEVHTPGSALRMTVSRLGPRRRA